MTNLIAKQLITEHRKGVAEAKNAFVNDFNADVEEANKLFKVTEPNIAHQLLELSRLAKLAEDDVLDLEPHIRLKFNSPDTVAECFPNVDEGLYTVLWNMTQYYDTSFSEEPDLEKNNTALFWDKFTYEQKVALNKAAERNQKLWEGE